MPNRSKGRGPSVGLIVTLIALLGAITTGGALNNVITLIHTHVTWWELVIDLLPSVVAGGFFITLYWAWRKVRERIAKDYPNLAGDVRTFLFSLKVADLVDLVDLRLGSLVAMTSTIFLKRIRQLGYDRLYSDPTVKDKVVANLIYGMATKKGKAELPPTKAQQELAERANQMPTTLWFDNEKELRDVFACGQNTVVHSLLRWMERENKGSEGEVTGRLREMWKRLQEDPFQFVPQLKGGASTGGTLAPIGVGAVQQQVTAYAGPKRDTA
jgi:hypothetical protein